jgi:hypothetical protein
MTDVRVLMTGDVFIITISLSARHVCLLNQLNFKSYLLCYAAKINATLDGAEDKQNEQF